MVLVALLFEIRLHAGLRLELHPSHKQLYPYSATADVDPNRSYVGSYTKTRPAEGLRSDYTPGKV